jgi:hypothetical protein
MPETPRGRSESHIAPQLHVYYDYLRGLNNILQTAKEHINKTAYSDHMLDPENYEKINKKRTASLREADEEALKTIMGDVANHLKTYNITDPEKMVKIIEPVLMLHTHFDEVENIRTAYANNTAEMTVNKATVLPHAGDDPQILAEGLCLAAEGIGMPIVLRIDIDSNPTTQVLIPVEPTQACNEMLQRWRIAESK